MATKKLKKHWSVLTVTRRSTSCSMSFMLLHARNWFNSSISDWFSTWSFTSWFWAVLTSAVFSSNARDSSRLRRILFIVDEFTNEHITKQLLLFVRLNFLLSFVASLHALVSLRWSMFILTVWTDSQMIGSDSWSRGRGFNSHPSMAMDCRLCTVDCDAGWLLTLICLRHQAV